MGSVCAVNLLDTAVKESVKLDVKVDFFLHTLDNVHVAVERSEKLKVKLDICPPPNPKSPHPITSPISTLIQFYPDEHCNHGQRGQPSWIPQDGWSLAWVC